MKGFIEVTYQTEKLCLNIRYIVRVMATAAGKQTQLTMHGGAIMRVEENYGEVVEKIKQASD